MNRQEGFAASRVCVLCSSDGQQQTSRWSGGWRWPTLTQRCPMALRRVRGILHVDRDDAPAVLERAKLMEKGLTDHAAAFLNPNPTLAVFGVQIVVTDRAQTTASTGGKGAA